MGWNIVTNEPIEATFYTADSEQLGVNVLHYTVLAVTGTPTSQQLVDEWDQSVKAKYPAWLSNEAFAIGSKMKQILGVPAAPSYSTGARIPGTSGSHLPRQLCGLISKGANLAGPQGRGRVYAAFPGIDLLDDGILSAAAQITLGGIADAFVGAPGDIVLAIGGGTSVTLRPVIKHGNGNASLFRVITTRHSSSQWATQRRRGFYGKANSIPSELP